MCENSTIQLTRQTKEELKSLKLTKGESYENIIKRLIHEHQKGDNMEDEDKKWKITSKGETLYIKCKYEGLNEYYMYSADELNYNESIVFNNNVTKAYEKLLEQETILNTVLYEMKAGETREYKKLDLEVTCIY